MAIQSGVNLKGFEAAAARVVAEATDEQVLNLTKQIGQDTMEILFSMWADDPSAYMVNHRFNYNGDEIGPDLPNEGHFDKQAWLEHQLNQLESVVQKAADPYGTLRIVNDVLENLDVGEARMHYLHSLIEGSNSAAAKSFRAVTAPRGQPGNRGQFAKRL